jgi:hypothetical protein
MRGRDADRPPDREVRDLEGHGEPRQRSYDDADTIESGSKRLRLPRSPRTSAVGLVLIIIIAVTAGYLVGTQRVRAADHTATPSSTKLPPAAGVGPITGTGNRCSAQLGDQLQLGVEIINRSATGATPHQVQAVLPLRGLRPTASAWGSCGQLSPVPSTRDYSLPAGATAWLTITFDVLIPCPESLPVLFTLNYTQSGRAGIADLRGFPDLGDVPYTSTRCPAGSS